jgi:hypothetical protein
LNILNQPLEVIDVNALAGDVTHKWFNQTLCKLRVRFRAGSGYQREVVSLTW